MMRRLKGRVRRILWRRLSWLPLSIFSVLDDALGAGSDLGQLVIVDETQQWPVIDLAPFIKSIDRDVKVLSSVQELWLKNQGFELTEWQEEYLRRFLNTPVPPSILNMPRHR